MTNAPGSVHSGSASWDDCGRVFTSCYMTFRHHGTVSGWTDSSLEFCSWLGTPYSSNPKLLQICSVPSVQIYSFILFFIYIFNLVFINRRNGPRYQRVLAFCAFFFFFLNGGNTEGTNFSKILRSMFVYVLFYVKLCRDWFCSWLGSKYQLTNFIT